MNALDTNVLIHAANATSPDHLRCRALLESLRAGAEPWGTTWGVVYEFLRVTTHPRVLPRPLTVAEAWHFMTAAMDSPSFRMLVPTERHAEIAGTTFVEHARLVGNLLHDAHVANLLREHGARRLYTFDADFLRFRFIDVVEPPDA